MKRIIAIYLLFFCQLTSGQTRKCSCAENFIYIKSYFEKNLASFKDNVPKNREKEYLKYCKSILEKTRKSKRNNNCEKYLYQYLSFFRDTHLSLRQDIPTINENNEEEVLRFKNSDLFKQTQILPLDTFELNQLYNKPLHGIEGIYKENSDNFYTVAVFKIKSSNIYKGIIIDSKTPIWDKWQVKFILKKQKNNTLNAILYKRYHQQERLKTSFEHGILNELGYSKLEVTPSIINSSPFEFTLLNDSTSYLKLSSFNGDLYSKIDSIYKKAIPKIKSVPYLIIDIRDNGGGSIICYKALKPLLYTKPVESDVVDILCTPENIKNYTLSLKEMYNNSADYGEEAISEVKKSIELMKKIKPYTFTELSGRTFYKQDSILKFPKKIALIFNKNTASSAEDFIFEAKQSKKIITIGENSSGYTGYGNYFEFKIPNSNMIVGYTTTRYRKQIKYEGVGFSPMIRLNKNQNWIKETLKALK